MAGATLIFENYTTSRTMTPMGPTMEYGFRTMPHNQMNPCHPNTHGHHYLDMLDDIHSREPLNAAETRLVPDIHL